MERLAPGTRFVSDIPGRLDRLPWSSWHWRLVTALGITWTLDGLEVTLVGAVAPLLAEPDTLALTAGQIGRAASAYLAGAVAGALVFGRLADMFGRRRLFFATLSVYVVATAMTGLSWSFASFALFRALTGAGIGGECSAVNSAIDELIPARVRGHADLAVNGTYWLGTVLGAALTLVLFNARVVPHALGWRLAFVLGAVLGAGVLFLRRHVPESPRWMLLHGRVAEAEAAVAEIERSVARGTALPPAGEARPLYARGSVSFAVLARVLLRHHLRRTILGLSLMIAQAFAYNGVFFTYALVLVRFYAVPASKVGLHIIPFALGNLLGPIVLGPLFDRVGRRPMMTVTYVGAGALMALAGIGMAAGWLTAITQTLLWSVTFFVASAAASSAYLAVSELFPVELRGMAIAIFYSAGIAAGGLVAPALFGALVESGDRGHVLDAYLVGAGLMVLAGVMAAILGVPAERRSLEQIADAGDVSR